MNTNCKYGTLSIALLWPALAWGQHQHEGHHTTEQQPTKSAFEADSGAMHHNHSGMAMTMSHLYSRNLPMNRNASGTAWHPDQTPMYMYMRHSKSGWMTMAHYSVFLRHTNQNFNNPNGKGREQRVDAPN